MAQQVAFLIVGICLLRAVTGGGFLALLRRSFEGANPTKVVRRPQ